MEIQEALRIMRALADGVNPGNGEALMPDTVFQDAPVVRAFHRAVSALEYLQERERSRKTPPANAGKSWSRAEDQQVARSCAGELIFTRSRRHGEAGQDGAEHATGIV
jgi:hypothetical protein